MMFGLDPKRYAVARFSFTTMSLDFIEDACNILDKGNESYILITGSGKKTRITSNLGKENAELAKKFAKEGFFDEQIIEHIERFYK